MVEPLKRGVGLNTLSHYKKENFFASKEKMEKKHEPQRSKRGYTDLSGSTTEKKLFLTKK